jgi:hypothetical protein
METIKELWNFLRTRKKYWLVPVIIVLFLIGFLVVFTAGSAIAPFVYTFF